MTDEYTEMWSGRDAETYARDLFLGKRRLDLDDDKISWILNHIDCSVSQIQGNESVESVVLYSYPVNGHDNEVVEKLGKAIGNLQAQDDMY
jgi:hypothetical protein